MALFNSFRLFALSVLFAAVYFIYFDSENLQVRLRRQTDLEKIDDLTRTCKNDALIALTFDDGPVTDGKTNTIYNRLQSVGIKATFHFGVEYLNNNAVKNLISSAMKLGHTIGMRWPNKLPPNSLSDEEFQATLKGYAERMRGIIGVYPRFLRFPNDNVQYKHVQLARTLGFEVTFYAVDAGDYSASADFNTLKDRIQEVVNMGATIVSRGSYIVLAQHTTAAGQGIDHAFTQFNSTFKFVTLDQCLNTTPYISSVNYGGNGADYSDTSSTAKAAAATSSSTRAATNLPLVILALIAVLFFQF